MSIHTIVLACDGCANVCGITAPTSINDARGTASAAFGWTRDGDLDHCATCSRGHDPGDLSSSLMVFPHDGTRTFGTHPDPPRTR
ncbi:hypothetical protein B0I32_106274 [Nonomuraea fuscirosea]|uniref:Uncharacterized protein n=1 Tax=Nonomuraea fuscirosea TaxID=1291556 RepID=A0A2T0N2C4_9ACTN|nr:hypothetical protein [Nonomuraea fuscirosea]PRX66138.1 hypothetical protein B0I32_106274 [Nonomuraea fuscirosea]